jgi:hypothetical protein
MLIASATILIRKYPDGKIHFNHVGLSKEAEETYREYSEVMKESGIDNHHLTVTEYKKIGKVCNEIIYKVEVYEIDEVEELKSYLKQK